MTDFAGALNDMNAALAGAQQPAESASPTPSGPFADVLADIANAKPAPTVEPLPWYQRALHGALDPLVGAGQFGAHLSNGWSDEMAFTPPEAKPEDAAASADQFVKQRENDYQAQRTANGQSGTDWARIAGNIASPVNAIPLGPPGASLATRAGMGAVTGAVGGLSQPVTGNDYWGDKGIEALANAGAGGALGPLAGAVRGSPSSDIEALRNAGVALTPGQGGGMVARANEALATRVPVLNKMVEGNQQNAIRSFNGAAINQALGEIGEKLPDELQAGHDAMSFAAGKFNNAYDALLPKLGFTADGDFQHGLAQVAENVATELPPAQATQLSIRFQPRPPFRFQSRPL